MTGVTLGLGLPLIKALTFNNMAHHRLLLQGDALVPPNTQNIPSRHVQDVTGVNSITELQHAEDNTRHTLSFALLVNPSASSPLAFHPSLPTCHLATSPVVHPSFHPSIHPSLPLIVHLFFTLFSFEHNGGIQLLLQPCLHAP